MKHMYGRSLRGRPWLILRLKLPMASQGGHEGRPYTGANFEENICARWAAGPVSNPAYYSHRILRRIEDSKVGIDDRQTSRRERDSINIPSHASRCRQHPRSARIASG